MFASGVLLCPSFNPRSRGGSDGQRRSFCSEECEFQSTLPRGERLDNSVGSCVVICFNPRSRGGSDGGDVWAVAGVIVSIHAPAGGATAQPMTWARWTQFQSTLPRGERPERIRSITSAWRFNPRSRGGSDGHAAIVEAVGAVSIHAPAGGATTNYAYMIDSAGFNPRSRGGSDGVHRPAAGIDYVSIHAPAGGATLGSVSMVG